MQLKVTLDEVRVPAVLQLSEEFCETHFLGGISAQNIKGLTEKRGFRHGPLAKDVLVNDAVNDGGFDIGLPTRIIVKVSMGPGVSPRQEIRFQRAPKGGLCFQEAPVGHGNMFKSARQAFR